jgi:hypothetical protein
MSNITRSEYMKVVNENKALKSDIKSIVIDLNRDVVRRWRTHFITEDDFMDTLKEYAKQYPSTHQPINP